MKKEIIIMKRNIKTIATLIVAVLLTLSMFACTAAPAAAPAAAP